MADRFCGADTDAFAAVDAFHLIDNGQVIFNSNGSDGAYFHTAAASDTSCFAGFHRGFGRPVVGTGCIRCQFMFWNEADQMLGACSNTFPAGNAIIVIDFGNAVFNIKCVKFADGDTIAKPEASVSARIGA